MIYAFPIVIAEKVGKEMEIKVERLDHLGIIAGVIKDLGIIELIDKNILPDDMEEITTGEAIAGMIINGLGFSDRPMTLTPQFFENKPLDKLLREGVKAEHLNRFKLGRSLDKVSKYGCDLLFNEIGMKVCVNQGVDMRFNSLDTTNFSLDGKYLPDSDEHEIKITYGHSKANRPDLKQIVLELMVSQDGGIPFISKSWDGNTSDNEIFESRAKELLKSASMSESFTIADSKLYSKDNSENLKKLLFITRIPGTLKEENKSIETALGNNKWLKLDNGNHYQCINLVHYDISQRWLVVWSPAAYDRATKTVNNLQEKELKEADKKLFHLQAERYSSEKEATDDLDKILEKLKLNKLKSMEIKEHKKYATKGKPKKNTPVKEILYQLTATVESDTKKMDFLKEQKACFVIGTNIPADELENIEVIKAYKNQSKVESGFRFLKEPVFFVSSLFLKKPSRIQGLLMVMTLALLVYSVAQRILRKQLELQNETIPNQINQPTATPTLKWIFQIFEGIDIVEVNLSEQLHVSIEGINQLRRKILMLFGKQVQQIYQIYAS